MTQLYLNLFLDPTALGQGAGIVQALGLVAVFGWLIAAAVPALCERKQRKRYAPGWRSGAGE
jgi:hypothetical protein